MNLDDWLSATPSDSQFAHLSDYNAAAFGDPIQIKSTDDPTSKRPRMDSSVSFSTALEAESSKRLDLEQSQSTPHSSPVQNLLGLHSTLQRIFKAYTDGGISKIDGTWTLQTAIEETFIATDKLVSIIEELNLQATLDAPQTATFPYRTNAHGDADRLQQRPSGHDSTSLLLLSCYVCVLEVYQVQVESMCDQAEDIVCERGSNLGRRRSDSSRAWSFSSPLTDIPVLNIGQFNLGTSPDRNIGLLLHVTQDMIRRLQGVVQLCATSNNEIEAYSPIHARNDYHARSAQSGLRTRRMESGLERNQDERSVRAMSLMFDSILTGIEARERLLKASIQEVKVVLKDSF
jgi:hypothetical protein